MRLRFALCLSLLAGCANVQHTTVNRSGDTTQLARPILSPNSLGETLTVNQVLRVAAGDTEATLNCVVAVTAQQITLVGMTALGMRAFTVKFDGTTITGDAQAAVPQALSPERLLNDVQLVYWPLSALKSALSRSDWQVSEPAPFTRRLRRGDRVIAEVHYTTADPWAGRAWLVNFEFDYTLNIESQRLAAAP